MTVSVGETLTVLSEVEVAGGVEGVSEGAAVEYQWYRETTPGAVRALIEGETWESLMIDPVKPSDAGRYVVVARNAAGAGEAVVVVEVQAGEAGGGGYGSGGSGAGSGNGGGSPDSMQRWWVFVEAEGGLYWVYDRVRQQSAWLWMGTDSEWKISAWSMEEQQVSESQKGGKGAKPGVLTFEVEATRPSAAGVRVWDGFALAGETGEEGVPDELTGSYGESGDGTRRAVRLLWSAAPAMRLSGASDWATVREAFSGSETGD
jgi:hypothetical protein